MTTTVCETLGPTPIPDDGRVELIATLPAGELDFRHFHQNRDPRLELPVVDV